MRPHVSGVAAFVAVVLVMWAAASVGVAVGATAWRRRQAVHAILAAA